MKNDDLKKILTEQIKTLNKSLSDFKKSYDKCSAIGIKKRYNFEESESFDALTSKFARISDIFTQKILRTILNLLHEYPLTFIDMANLSEKIGIISSSDELLEIRELRNTIAHEYIEENLVELYKDVLKYSPILIDYINNSFIFAKKKLI